MGDRLAIDGGTPVRTVPFGRAHNFGDEDIAALAEVVRSGNLSRGSWTAASEVTTRPVEADGSWGSTLS